MKANEVFNLYAAGKQDFRCANLWGNTSKDKNSTRVAIGYGILV
jgi:hypothetical protein